MICLFFPLSALLTDAAASPSLSFLYVSANDSRFCLSEGEEYVIFDGIGVSIPLFPGVCSFCVESCFVRAKCCLCILSSGFGSIAVIGDRDFSLLFQFF